MPANGRTVSLKIDERGRVTIPNHIREYFGLIPEDDDEEVWVELTVHGRDQPENGSEA